MSRSRSTYNWISGDVPHRLPTRLLWLVNNIVAGLPPQPSSSVVRTFSCDPSLVEHPLIRGFDTPARVLSDLFWLALDTQDLRTRLGPIRVADIGCGQARYLDFIKHLFPEFESYRGIDVQPRPRWPQLMEGDARISFHEADASQLSASSIADSNFLFTQSAIEHFRDDLTFLRTLGDAFRHANGPMLQIHLTHPGHQWRQYGLHGYRGYAPRALNRLVEEMSRYCAVRVFPLGGKHSNRFHLHYVRDTLRRSVRKSRAASTPGYTYARNRAILADLTRPPIKTEESTLLAIVGWAGEGDFPLAFA